jgi:hypothetical protein
MKALFIYHFWCYDNGYGTQPYPNSVELDVKAYDEEGAMAGAKKMVNRSVYKLQTVRNEGSNKTN